MQLPAEASIQGGLWRMFGRHLWWGRRRSGEQAFASEVQI